MERAVRMRWPCGARSRFSAVYSDSFARLRQPNSRTAMHAMITQLMTRPSPMQPTVRSPLGVNVPIAQCIGGDGGDGDTTLL
eukprot:5695395-Prymnesium_polylepis.2